MTEATKVTLVKSGICEYQRKFGIDRKYPQNGVPETRAGIVYTDEEKAYLSKPLLYHAKRYQEKQASG